MLGGADLGTTRGRNLFHSFRRIGIETGGRVKLTGPGGLDYVISRVTGSTASRFDRTLRSTVPGADLYLLNPAGILFGPHARVAVPAAFHVGTANRLELKDGATLDTGAPTTNGITLAEPKSFGFLGTAPGQIAVDARVIRGAQGNSISLVGGNVEIRFSTTEPLS